ncbi:hypothetical protein Bbelb_248040 [Branchiostoma belcheri]|nr:hypothetical protein Bbelb_248040 [Branchiostoma belcheri]
MAPRLPKLHRTQEISLPSSSKNKLIVLRLLLKLMAIAPQTIQVEDRGTSARRKMQSPATKADEANIRWTLDQQNQYLLVVWLTTHSPNSFSSRGFLPPNWNEPLELAVNRRVFDAVVEPGHVERNAGRVAWLITMPTPGSHEQRCAEEIGQLSSENI